MSVSNFLSTPDRTPGSQQVHVPQVVQPVQFRPPVSAPAPLPLLTIHQSDTETRATLHQALVASIPGFRHGSRFHVVAPRTRGGQWYLDTRPKPGQGVQLPAPPAKYQVRLPRIAPTHFIRPRPVTKQGQAGRLVGVSVENQHMGTLCFRLGEELREEVCVKDELQNRMVCETRGTGYYRLMPA
jgi:hypothetical protein